MPDRQSICPRDIVVASNFIADCFRRRVADTRTEVHEVLAPSILRPPGSKGIAPEVELLVKISSPPVIVFAIDDARFVRMKLQTAFSKALLQFSPY